MMFSPLTIKRFRSFKRIKRAWYSLIVLGLIYVFCLLANYVCPYDPLTPIDPQTLEPYLNTYTERVYDVKTARCSLLSDGTIMDFEGPQDLKNAWDGKLDSPLLADYEVKTTQREGYTRVYMNPKSQPDFTDVEKQQPLAFPFRPVPGHPFGIDSSGRDVYSRVIHGMRIALNFGLLLAIWAMFMGLVIGSIEGYFGGWTDIFGQRMTEIWSSIPFLYVMIFIGSALERSFWILLICYGIFNWIAVSYYMRAEFLRLRTRTFVEAAKCQGFSPVRIIFGHILPNALTPLITLFPFLLMGAIGSLAALDFLGFGLPPMWPSCGELLNQAQQYRDAWWLVLFPSLALFIVMLLTVLVGEGLRDAFDPRQKSRLE